MPYATPQIELALTGDNVGSPAGIFAFDSSLFDGADVFGGGFGGDVLDDITADVKTVGGSRGRSTDLGAIEMGTMQVVLADPTGKYNPRGTQEPGIRIRPMRRIRCRLTHNGTIYGRFSGFIRRAWHNPAKDVKESYIDAVDLFLWLSRVRPTIAATGATTVGQCIGLILDASEWPDGERHIDDGSNVPDFSADGTKSSLQLIQDLLVADLGLFFIDKDGLPTYRDRDSRWGPQDPVATLSGDLLSGALPGVDGERLVNSQTVTRAGGEPQTATDADSRATHGLMDGAPVNTPYLTNDHGAAALAGLLVALQKEPIDRSLALVLHNRDDDTIGYQVALDVGDHVAITAATDGSVAAVEGSVARIDWRIDLAGRHDTVQLAIGERILTGFAFDESLFDGDDVFL